MTYSPCTACGVSLDRGFEPTEGPGIFHGTERCAQHVREQRDEAIKTLRNLIKTLDHVIAANDDGHECAHGDECPHCWAKYEKKIAEAVVQKYGVDTAHV
jgi:hypothetical protein